MKIYLKLIVFLVLLVPVVAVADTINVSDTTNVTMGDSTFQINGKIDTISSDGGTLSVTLPADTTYNVDIVSTDKYTFTYTETVGWNVSFTCDTNQSKLSFSAPTISKTVTVTPVTTACTSSSNSSNTGSGSSGGGGGGSYAPAPVAAVVALVPTPVPAVISASAPVAPTMVVSAVFTKSLSLGAVSSDIKRLQQLLNSDPETKIAATGAGSPGNETDRFGLLTKAAVIKFQIKNGIVKTFKDLGAGTFGPKTRAKLKELFGGATSVAPQSVPASVSSADQLKTLQDKINALLLQIQSLKR